MLKNKIIAGAMALIMPLTMCLTGCSVIPMFNTFTYQYDNGSEYTPGDREIDEKITKINLDYVSGSVTIKASDTDKVSVKETANAELSEAQKVHTWVNDGTLYVRFCQSVKRINFFNINKTLELTLPSSQDLEDVIVKVSSGNLTCNDFTSSNITAHLSSGNLTCSGVKAGGLEAKLSSGNAVVDCSGKNIQINSSSGNVALTEKGDSENINIKASSGNITVTQSGSCNAMTINSSSGNVKAEADKVSKMDVKASSGNITITGNEITDLNSKSSSGHNTFDFAKAPKTSEIKSSSGWVKIYMPGDSDVTVRAKISSGDFNSELPFSKSGKEYTSGNGSSTMNINVSSGDVDIYKK
ncbi:MAG: DUF4097 family beta strand repeat protein [Clostridiales bacterium]|nr:DUF4097 family beta strand repeat protein [Clostridiales bacterium]